MNRHIHSLPVVLATMTALALGAGAVIVTTRSL